MAQRLATIDHFSGGRVIFGLGAGEAINLDPFNIEWRKPVSKLVEYVEIMRQLWGEEPFSHEGPFWRFKEAFLQIKPVQSHVPIYFAANRPRMRRLTGEMADGWLPGGLTPKMYKTCLKEIRESARKAGRNPDDIDAGLYICTSIANNSEDAYNQLEPSKVILKPNTLKEAGYETELPEKFNSYSPMDWKPTQEYMNFLAEYRKYVPREAMIDFSIGGTVQQCIDRIDEFVTAGVKHFILEFIGPDMGACLKMVERYGKAIIPRFAEG